MNPDQYFTASMVSLLKGAPLAIYILLRISHRPESAAYLQRYSRYSDKVVQQGLLFLQEQNLISRNGRFSWQLTNYGSQLPLMAQTGLEPIAGVENESMDLPLMAQTGLEPLQNTQGLPTAGEMDPESSASDPCNDGGDPRSKDGEEWDTEIPIRKFRVGNSVSLARVFNLDSSNTRHSRKEDLASESEIPYPTFRLLLAALERYGIREPARSRLARMADMTLERIEYHCSTCSPGQAIYRIEHNWPAPKKAAGTIPEEPFEPQKSEGEQEDQEDQEDHEVDDLPQEVLDAWDKTLVQLEGSIPQALYANCVYPLRIGGFADRHLVMQAANQWVISRLREMGMGENEIGQIFSGHFGRQVSVRFEVGRLC